MLRWISVAATVVLVAGTLAAYLKYRAVYDSIARVPVTDLGKRPVQFSTSSLNILVYGSDGRAGLTHHQQVELHTGNDQGQNTNTVMLVHISPGRHQVTVMSIPRDTMVPMYQCDGGAGYPAGGPIRTRTSSSTPCCPSAAHRACSRPSNRRPGYFVDHFRRAGHARLREGHQRRGRRERVRAPFNVNDPVSGLQLTAGEPHINGIQALAFWRTREDIGTGSGPRTDPARPVHVGTGGQGRAGRRPAVQPDPAAQRGHRRCRLDDHGLRHERV